MSHESVVRTIIEPDPYTIPRIRVGVVEIDGDRLVLTAREFIIWDALYRRRGRFVDLGTIEAAASEWGTARATRPWRHTARVHLCRLREKMADQGVPFTIETVRYVGHKMVATQEESSCSKP